MEALLKQPTQRWNYKHTLGAIALGTLGILATSPTWEDILFIAMRDQEQSHIWLVLPISLVLFWVRRARIRYCRPTGQILGPILVALGWMIGTWGFYHNVQSFWHVGAVIVVIGCVIAILGRHALLRFVPAILVLIFLVPVPGMIRLKIAQPLQAQTASISNFVLNLVGIETELAGNSVTINGQPVDIIEACNGMRMIFPLILVCYAFVFALPLRNWVRLLLLILSPGAAILCNLVRIIPNIYLASLKDPTWFNRFHTYSGWLMLPIAFLLLIGIVKLLRWATIPVMRYTLAGQ